MMNTMPTNHMTPAEVLAYEVAQARRRMEMLSARQARFLLLNEKMFNALGETKAQVEATAMGYFRIMVTGTKEDLLAVWKVLRNAGQKPEKHPGPTEVSFSTWWEDESCGSMLILIFSSTVCKMVQVGTITVEQPKYEMSCGQDVLGSEVEAVKQLEQL